MNYQSSTPLHADFYLVNLKEKIKTMVPVVLTGEPQAVADKVGMLLQTLSEVEVEALPDKLPENVEISVEHLAAVGDGITVADIKVQADVVVLTDATQGIAKIAELVAPEEPEAETAEGEEGAAEGEAAEGETPAAEGTETEEGSTEEKPAEENKA